MPATPAPPRPKAKFSPTPTPTAWPIRTGFIILIGTLLSGDYAGVGGPNVSPPAENWVQACVAAAPGGPSHVLLTDTVAEHIPGCNMAFYRWAFETIGGFDIEYRKAGDDVDFCWRLQQDGHVIAFSPTAIVWHHRRFTLRAFRKQQEGYGEAESMLRFKHLIFFGPTGTAKWRGQIYGSPRFSWFINRPIIYHGIFGEGFFQSIYPTPQSEIADYLSSIEWFALTLFLFGLGIFLPVLRIVPYLMLGGTLVRRALLHAARADRAEVRHRCGASARHVPRLRPATRSGDGSAISPGSQFKRTPRAVIRTHEKMPAGEAGHVATCAGAVYWSEDGVERNALLRSIFDLLEEEGWRYSADTGWKEWDIQIYGNFFWSVILHTVTEYHGGPKCLTRVRLRYRFVTTTVIINLLFLAMIHLPGLE